MTRRQFRRAFIDSTREDFKDKDKNLIRRIQLTREEKIFGVCIGFFLIGVMLDTIILSAIIPLVGSSITWLDASAYCILVVVLLVVGKEFIYEPVKKAILLFTGNL